MATSLEELQDGLHLASAEVLSLLRSEPNIHALTLGGEWTVRETAVHLIIVARMYTGMLNGRPPKGNVVSGAGPFNEGAFLALNEDRPRILGDLYKRAVARFLEATDGRRRDDPCTFYAEVGEPTTVGTLSAFAVFESLLHGADMAFAVDRGWSCPEQAADAAFAVNAATMVRYGFSRKAAGDLDASYALESPGGRLCYQIRGGAIAQLDEGTDTDCSISGPSSRWLLWLSGRTPWEKCGLLTSGNLADRFAASLTHLGI